MKVHGQTFLISLKKESMVDVDILHVLIMIRSMFLVVALCLIEKDKSVSAHLKSWSMILLTKHLISWGLKVSPFNQGRIIVQLFLVTLCLYMEDSLKMVLSIMMYSTLIYNTMIGLECTWKTITMNLWYRCNAVLFNFRREDKLKLLMSIIYKEWVIPSLMEYISLEVEMLKERFKINLGSLSHSWQMVRLFQLSGQKLNSKEIHLVQELVIRCNSYHVINV